MTLITSQDPLRFGKKGAWIVNRFACGVRNGSLAVEKLSILAKQFFRRPNSIFIQTITNVFEVRCEAHYVFLRLTNVLRLRQISY